MSASHATASIVPFANTLDFDVSTCISFRLLLISNYQLGLSVSDTRLATELDTLHIPFGSPASLVIDKPTVTIDISPLFKFVVLTVTGSISFNLFGKALEADVSMLIDNLEANFGVVIKGDHSSLPAPPVMKSVHFEEFGVGIGAFFEPPSATFGLSGKLHIGDPDSDSQVALNDNTFVVVCQLIEEVPNPLYISFYVSQMHLADVLKVFTNAQTTALDVPVSFTDLSFKWSEDPMGPVALPDGSLSDMGYGFSAATNILAFSFYGDIEIDLSNGLTVDLEMAPLAFGNVFSIGGNGTGMSIKVDASGSPIKNNQLVTKAAQQQALKSATMKQLVPSGGPVLKLRTSASPLLHLNGHVSLFEVSNAQLDANITSSGITFEVSYGTLLTRSMSCSLSDYHNLATTFQFGINETVPLPSINGVNLDSIVLQATINAHLSLSTSLSNLILQVGGNFVFEGMNRTFGDFVADAHIQRVSDLLSAIVSYIKQNANQLFNDLLDTGAVWASKVKQSVVTTANSVSSVLHNAYSQDANQVASTMKGVGYSIDETAGQLKSIFNPTQVASALKNVFGQSELGVAQAMKQVGYTGEEAAGALKDTFGSDAGQRASALHGAYGWSTDQIKSTMSSLGFATDQIGHAFQSLGSDFTQAGSSILNALNPSNVANEVTHKLDPRHWI